MRLRTPALAAILTLLSASGCLGGQTGDPSAGFDSSEECPIALEDALDVIERFEGSYSASVVRSEEPPETCVDGDTTLHVEVESVLDDEELSAKPCGAAWLPVSLHLWTEDQELDLTRTAWVSANGEVVFDEPNGVPAIQLLDPPNMEANGNGLWTLTPCCSSDAAEQPNGVCP